MSKKNKTNHVRTQKEVQAILEGSPIGEANQELTPEIIEVSKEAPIEIMAEAPAPVVESVKEPVKTASGKATSYSVEAKGATITPINGYDKALEVAQELLVALGLDKKEVTITQLTDSRSYKAGTSWPAEAPRLVRISSLMERGVKRAIELGLMPNVGQAELPAQEPVVETADLVHELEDADQDQEFQDEDALVGAE